MSISTSFANIAEFNAICSNMIGIEPAKWDESYQGEKNGKDGYILLFVKVAANNIGILIRNWKINSDKSCEGEILGHIPKMFPLQKGKLAFSFSGGNLVVGDAKYNLVVPGKEFQEKCDAEKAADLAHSIESLSFKLAQVNPEKALSILAATKAGIEKMVADAKAAADAKAKADADAAKAADAKAKADAKAAAAEAAKTADAAK